LRGRVETFFPIVPYIRGLARLGCDLLPDSSWLPLPLRLRQVHLTPAPSEDSPDSILDLWRMLPEHLADDPAVPPTSPETLYCALADPQRFGTGVDRYPEQLQRIGTFASTHTGRALSVIDIGCGIGLGTLEIARVVQTRTTSLCRVVGLTREPLEAWMATHRRAPHAPERETAMRAFAPDLPAAFVAADATRVPLQVKADIVVCNGLIGGDAFHSPDQYNALLDECNRILTPGGCLFAANRFHDGVQTRVAQFLALAQRRRWHVAGTSRDVVIGRHTLPGADGSMCPQHTA
jgi:SAM-dependent methyltransferase